MERIGVYIHKSVEILTHYIEDLINIIIAVIICPTAATVVAVSAAGVATVIVSTIAVVDVHTYFLIVQYFLVILGQFAVVQLHIIEFVLHLQVQHFLQLSDLFLQKLGVFVVRVAWLVLPIPFWLDAFRF